MAATAFAAAIFVTLAVLVGRRWRHRRQQRAFLSHPGRRPETAVRVSRYDEIDATVAAARCHCGGRLSTISEGSRPVDAGTLRVVHCECLLCEDVADLFFAMDEVLH